VSAVTVCVKLRENVPEEMVKVCASLKSALVASCSS